jgi:DNA polymerase III subunit delta'
VIFDRVIGHKTQTTLLKKALKDKNLASRALLFSGPSGIGKKLIAMAWAQGLLCEKENKPCGTCFELHSN